MTTSKKPALAAQPAPAAVPPEGGIVVSKNEAGQIVCVSRQDEDGQFLSIIAESADAVPLTDEKIDHTLATTLDEFARTTRGMSHALDVNADITANSRLRRMFARAVLAAAGDKP